ncbi:MAG: dTDP-glucose 4,6-dehydratase [Patescibacteria group bacterium]
MNILITGGAGFIGSNFVHYWRANHPDDNLTVIDSLTYAGNKANIQNEIDAGNVTFIEQSINDKTGVYAIFEKVKPDMLVHFAAETHVDRSLDNSHVFLETNILGTHNLLEAARDHGIQRFHHISTDEVFGSLKLGDQEKFSENTPYDPRSPYSASKAAADHLVRAFGESFDLPFSITNCSNNYGPYQYPEKFLPRMITNVMHGEKIPIYGDGLYVRDWLYVDDHCRAIDLIVQNQDTLGKTYCVGGSTEDTSNKDLALMVLEHFGYDESWLETVRDRAGHDRRYAVDWSLIKKDLGWEPLHNTADWLEKTIIWYKENESWWKPLKEESDQFYAKTA